MKYLINSNHAYSGISLKKLIPSLIDCGINPKDILVITGGHKEESSSFHDVGTHQCFDTKINAIDQTAFYVMDKYENLFQDQLYFYLHDTVFAGYNFKKYVDDIVSKINIKEFKALKICDGKSCNMGIYNKIHLLNSFRKNVLYINCKKIFCDTIDPNNIKKLEYKKQLSIRFEDKIINDLTKNFICNKDILGKFDIYGTGNNRVLFYFKVIDLYKAGANAQINDPTLYTMSGCKI
jgi:hypothetical protein